MTAARSATTITPIVAFDLESDPGGSDLIRCNQQSFAAWGARYDAVMGIGDLFVVEPVAK